MGRDEIARQIREQMRNRGDAPDGGDVDRDAPFCQQCGSEVDDATEHLVHRIPEHGEDEVRNVFYCSATCFQKHMDELLDY